MGSKYKSFRGSTQLRLKGSHESDFSSLTIRFKKHLTPHITGSTINETLNETLNTAVLSTYELIKGSPGINRKELINRSGCAASTLSRHIVILTEKGLIERRGSKKVGGYYAK